jgi:MFS family permease
MSVAARTTWRSVSEHRALAVLLCAALPVEIAAAANLVLRVGGVDSAGGGALGIGGAFAAMSLAFAVAVIPAGFLVDRTPPRLTFAVALAIRALPMLLGGLLVLAGSLSTTALVALAAGDGLAMALLRPSWQHFQARLVPTDAIRDAAVLDGWIARAGALAGALAGGAAVAAGLGAAGQLACAAGFVPLLTALALGLGAVLRKPISTSASTRSLRRAWSALRGTPRLAHATRADVVLSLALPVGVLAPAITVALTAVHYLWLIAFAAGVGALAGATWVTLTWHRDCPAQLLRRATGVLITVLAIEAVVVGGGLRGGGDRRMRDGGDVHCHRFAGAGRRAGVAAGRGHRPGPGAQAHRDLRVGIGGGRDDGLGRPRGVGGHRRGGRGGSGGLAARVQRCGERCRLRQAWDAWPERSRPMGWWSAAVPRRDGSPLRSPVG